MVAGAPYRKLGRHFDRDFSESTIQAVTSVGRDEVLHRNVDDAESACDVLTLVKPCSHELCTDSCK